MVTCGGDMSGYCSIGDTDIETAPASTIRREMTDESIGRSMKKWVNTEPRLLLRRLAVLRRFHGGALTLGRSRDRFADLHRLSRNDLQRPFHHDAVARLQPARDQDALLIGIVADHHGPQLGRAVLLHDVDDMAFRALLHGELGHDDRVWARAALHVRSDEHARAQKAMSSTS